MKKLLLILMILVLASLAFMPISHHDPCGSASLCSWRSQQKAPIVYISAKRILRGDTAPKHYVNPTPVSILTLLPTWVIDGHLSLTPPVQ